MNELLSIETLGNFGIMTSIVLTTVQVIKKLLDCFVFDLDNRVPLFIALALSFGIVFANQYISGDWSIVNIILAIFNSFAVFSSATAGFRAVKGRVKEL